MSLVRLTLKGLAILVNFLKYGKFTYTQEYEPSQTDFERVMSVLVNFLKYGKFTYTHDYEPSQIDFKRVICLSQFSKNMGNSPIHRNISRVRLTSNGLSVLVNFLKYGKFTYTQDYQPSQIDFKTGYLS